MIPPAVVPPSSHLTSSHTRYATFPSIRGKGSRAPFMSLNEVREPIKKKGEQDLLKIFVNLRSSSEEASIIRRRQYQARPSSLSDMPVPLPVPAAASSSTSSSSASLGASSSTSSPSGAGKPVGFLPPVSMRLSSSISERVEEASPENQIELARKWVKKHQLQRALKIIEKVLATSSLSKELRLEALTVQGHIYKQQESFELAIRNYNEILVSHPLNIEILNALTDCYLKQKMNTEALETAHRVLEMNPVNGTAWKHQGCVWFSKGDDDKTLKCLWNARKYGVSDYFVLTTLGEIYFKRGKFIQAIAYFEEAYKNYQDFSVLAKLGKLYFLAEDLDQAIERFDQVIMKDPAYLPAYKERGLCYLKRGEKTLNPEDLSKAIGDFNYYLTEHQKDSEALGMIGLAQALLKSSKKTEVA